MNTKNPTKAVVLLSGGVDSATCLGKAVKTYGKENVAAISVFYGQRHSKEIECAENLADYYGVPQFLIDLSQVFEQSTCSLLKHSSTAVPEGTYESQLKDAEHASTYVPFRNGLMLSAVASYAMSLFENEPVVIYIGAHSDDAAGNAYPDCSTEFIFAMNESIRLGSDGYVTIVAPFVGYHKSDVVKTGLDLGVPYHLTWSCYKGGEYACGKCGTCLDRIAAFKANGATDPITYEGYVFEID